MLGSMLWMTRAEPVSHRVRTAHPQARSRSSSSFVAKSMPSWRSAATSGITRPGFFWSRRRAAVSPTEREDTRAIKAEATDLRQYVASSSAEQVVFLKILVLKPDIDLALARNIARHTHHYAAIFKRDPDLVLAIIAEESRFDPNAISPVGAVGLMQVMPQWEKVLGISGSLKDPEVAIKYGLEVFGFYMEMYKDIEMALTAYNRGPGPVDVALMRGKDPKNLYAPKVMKVYERLKRLGITPGA